MSAVRRPLKIELPGAVHRLSEAFKAQGHVLYVVGGAVRDSVMGLEPKDIDLATDATPDQVLQIVVDMAQWSADETGKAFGVVRASLREQFAAINELSQFEVATFREDLTAGRHPEVRFATIKEDVQRRDLTINALFYDIDRQEVVDLVGGLEDIALGRIRTVGRPEDRFAEDRLRILRALRFAARFGYSLDCATSEAILRDNSLAGVSSERVYDELVKSIASARETSGFLDLMDEHNMWPQVFPGLQVSGSRVHARTFEVVVALLLRSNDPTEVLKALNRLKYPSNVAAKVAALPRFRRLSTQNAYDLRRLFQRTGLTLEELKELEHDCVFTLHRGLELFGAYLASPPVRGDDLLAQGYSGPALGVELQRRETEAFERLLVTHGQ